MKPRVEPADVRYEIMEAFRRAEIDLARITIEVEGAEVSLRGSVRSAAEREEAELRARSVEGVAKVDNLIQIETPRDNGVTDAVYEASLESFPASDAPAWTVGASHVDGEEARSKSSKAGGEPTRNPAS